MTGGGIFEPIPPSRNLRTASLRAGNAPVTSVNPQVSMSDTDYLPTGCGERNEEPRVVGGMESNVNAFPWLGRLIYEKAFGCAASLINDRFVISAAHCMKGFMWFLFRVKFGEHDRCDKSQQAALTRYVVKVIAHNFTLSDLSNDIALLMLNKPVEYTHAIRPVCLPATDDNTYTSKTAIVAGWGAMNETGKWSCTVREAELPVLSNEACRNTNYNATKIKEVMMCAGFPETAHKDACTGDSGGPLITENEDHMYDLIGRSSVMGLWMCQERLSWSVYESHEVRAENDTEPVTETTMEPVIEPESVTEPEPEPTEYARKCSCRCGERNEASRIVGGVETAVNEFPWVARLSLHNKFYCGASLINDRYVLTAAHCVKTFMWFMIKVTLGEHNRCNTTHRPVTRFVVQVVSHNFSFATFRDDIAVLKLNEAVQVTDSVKPVCLPRSDDKTYVGVKAMAAGWGTVAEGKNHSCYLQEVDLPILSNEACKNANYTSEMIGDGMLCAGYPEVGKKDTCQGDSGGPLSAERSDKRHEQLGKHQKNGKILPKIKKPEYY
ncbi:unnamed protein product [Spodoptera exigua]|nr:unnamed protein product [Spodoptera exigua]